MKNPHLKQKGKGKHLQMLLFDHKLLCLSCCCIFHTAKLNLFFVKAKLTLELHQNRSAQTQNSLLHPTFTQYLPLNILAVCLVLVCEDGTVCVWVEQSTKEAESVSLCQPCQRSCSRTQGAVNHHCTPHKSAQLLPKCWHSFSFAANLLQPSKSELQQFSVL